MVAWLLATAVALVASCASPPTPSSPQAALPSATAPNLRSIASPTEQEIADATRFRKDYGLRADDAWVRQIADDATANRTSFGVPLTVQEVDDLNHRPAAIEDIKALVVDYGRAHPEDYAGAFTDQQHGGQFVAQFSANVAAHRAALFAQVRPGAPLDVREVHWSLRQLQAFADQLDGNDPWFETIPAVIIGWGPDVIANRLWIEASSIDADLEKRIESHFGWPSGLIAVESDGTGALLLETGTLRVIARKAHGEPIAGLACVAIPDLDGAYDPRPVPMPTTDATGTCALRLPATGYWIRLEKGEAPPTLVAIGRAVVVAGHTEEVIIQAK